MLDGPGGGKRRGGSTKIGCRPAQASYRLRFPIAGNGTPFQLAGFALPQCDNVLGKECYDKIFATTADRYLSPAFFRRSRRRQTLTLSHHILKTRKPPHTENPHLEGS